MLSDLCRGVEDLSIPIKLQDLTRFIKFPVECRLPKDKTNMFMVHKSFQSLKPMSGDFDLKILESNDEICGRDNG